MNTQSPPALDAKGLTKSYHGICVLDDVFLNVAAGEVHALLGENGAGKSTLVRILSGAIQPTAGSFSVSGDAVEFADPRAAERNGVATVHQEHSVVPGLSVAENLFLGRAMPSRLGLIKRRELDRRARAIVSQLGFSLDVRRDIAELSPVEQTLVAVARALALDARLLVLDEPTASLTEGENAKLFQAIRRAAQLGVGVLYVSHRLDEVFDIADRYTVLRNGRLAASGAIVDTSIRRVIAAMAGREIEAIFPERIEASQDVMMRVSGLCGRRARDVTFDVREREIVGIAGLAGSGRSDILRLVSGARRRAGGDVHIRTREFRPRTPLAAHRAGVVCVPEERGADGLVPGSVESNLNLSSIDTHARPWPFVRRRSERANATRLWREFHVRGRSTGQDVFELSGGNQQKVLLAKYLALAPSVVLLDEPTRGVDVGTKFEIYRLISSIAADGAAVMIVSSELLELMGLCHRIVVVHEGRITADVGCAEFDQERLLEAFYGHNQR